MNIIEIIKAEVKKQIEHHDSLASNTESEMIANLEIGAAQALEDLLPFLSTLESEKPMNQDGLEEEINRYFEPIHAADIQFEPFTQMTKCARHFAQWGANHTPLPEDTVLFQKGVAEGKRLMMEEAVEGEVVKDISNKLAVTAKINLDGFKFGDKVRVIVLPKEDEK